MHAFGSTVRTLAAFQRSRACGVGTGFITSNITYNKVTIIMRKRFEMEVVLQHDRTFPPAWEAALQVVATIALSSQTILAL